MTISGHLARQHEPNTGIELPVLAGSKLLEKGVRENGDENTAVVDDV